VPTGATTGNVVVHASGVDSNGLGFTVVAAEHHQSVDQHRGGGRSSDRHGCEFWSDAGQRLGELQRELGQKTDTCTIVVQSRNVLAA